MHKHTCIKNWGGQNLYPPTIYTFGRDELLNAEGKMPSNSWWCDSTVVIKINKTSICLTIPVCFARVLSKENGLDRYGTCVNTGNQG